MIFISHDTGVIGYVSHRIAAMYMGRVAEVADTKTVLDRLAPDARADGGGSTA